MTHETPLQPNPENMSVDDVINTTVNLRYERSDYLDKLLEDLQKDSDPDHQAHNAGQIKAIHLQKEMDDQIWEQIGGKAYETALYNFETLNQRENTLDPTQVEMALVSAENVLYSNIVKSAAAGKPAKAAAEPADVPHQAESVAPQMPAQNGSVSGAEWTKALEDEGLLGTSAKETRTAPEYKAHVRDMYQEYEAVRSQDADDINELVALFAEAFGDNETPVAARTAPRLGAVAMKRSSSMKKMPASVAAYVKDSRAEIARQFKADRQAVKQKYSERFGDKNKLRKQLTRKDFIKVGGSLLGSFKQGFSDTLARHQGVSPLTDIPTAASKKRKQPTSAKAKKA